MKNLLTKKIFTIFAKLMRHLFILLSISLFSCKKESIVTHPKVSTNSLTHNVVFQFESGCQGYDVAFTDENKTSQSAKSSTTGNWTYTFKASSGDELYFFGREYQCLIPNRYRSTWRLQVDGKEVGYLNDIGSNYLRYTIP
jgi:hypothetical protein